MKKQTSYIFFTLLSIAYLFSLDHSPYTGQFLLKVAPIIMLSIIAVLQLSGRIRQLIVVALVASGTGDVFLALSIPNSFIFGLGAFLIAQVIYSVTFIQCRRKQTVSLSRKLLALIITLYSMAMAAYILPATDGLFIPVAVYLCVISVMGLSAILGGLPNMVVVGALSFVASDSALALRLFKTPVILSDYVVMVTYYFAQFAILIGMIHLHRHSADTSKPVLATNAR